MPLQRGISESIRRGPSFRRVTQTGTRCFTGSPPLRLAWPPRLADSSLAWSRLASRQLVLNSAVELSAFSPNFSTSMPLVPDPSSFGPNLHRRLQRTCQFSPQRNWLKSFLSKSDSQTQAMHLAEQKQQGRDRVFAHPVMFYFWIWILIVYFSLFFFFCLSSLSLEMEAPAM